MTTSATFGKRRGLAKEGNTGIVIYNVTSQNTRGNYKREPYVLVLTPLGHVSEWGGGGKMPQFQEVVVYDLFGEDAGEEKGLVGNLLSGWREHQNSSHEDFCRSVHMDKTHAFYALT